MTTEVPYIDWSKAPEGTTHAYVGDSYTWSKGSPSNHRAWEKHLNGTVSEWNTFYGWRYYTERPVMSARIEKPKEESEMIERDKVYDIKVTGEQLFFIALLTGKTNGRWESKSSLYSLAANMLSREKAQGVCAGVIWEGFDLIGSEKSINKALDKVFSPPKSPQQKEYEELLRQIDVLKEQAEKCKPKG